MSREITIDRNDIIMGLADEAKFSENDRARVAAWTVLSDIYMLRAKAVKDIYDFYGWTAEELVEFGRSATVPERFRARFAAATGVRALEGGNVNFRKEKK